jgi:hypothetical protein
VVVVVVVVVAAAVVVVGPRAAGIRPAFDQYLTNSQTPHGLRARRFRGCMRQVANAEAHTGNEQQPH